MGKIEGIKIHNYGPLKDIILGKTRSNQKEKALGNLVYSGLSQTVWRWVWKKPAMQTIEADMKN